MKKLFLISILIVSFLNFINSQDIYDYDIDGEREWLLFLAKHGAAKAYPTFTDKLIARKNFRDNWKQISMLNQRKYATYKLYWNWFSDLTHAKYVKQALNFAHEKVEPIARIHVESPADLTKWNKVHLDNAINAIPIARDALKNRKAIIDYISKKGRQWVKVLSGSEYALLDRLEKSPLAVHIDASSFTFRHYSSGVYNEKHCKKHTPNHFALLVGRNMSTVGYIENSINHWIVKNTWGLDWGNDGHIHLASFEDNVCGIATHAVSRD